MLSEQKLLERLRTNALFFWLHEKCGLRAEDISIETIPQLLVELQRQRGLLIKMMGRGGVVIVVEDNTLITTYRTDSYRRNR